MNRMLSLEMILSHVVSVHRNLTDPLCMYYGFQFGNLWVSYMGKHENILNVLSNKILVRSQILALSLRSSHAFQDCSRDYQLGKGCIIRECMTISGDSLLVSATVLLLAS